MRTFKLLCGLAVGFILNGFNIQAQQLKLPAPSPLQTIEQAFGLSDIRIEYSRPSAKGRTIYGDLVPYGKIWRTGANASTKVTFGNDVKVEGKALPAGTYALYTIPGQDSWTVMFYKDLALGGNVAAYADANEALRVSIKPVTLNSPVETFTIQVANITPTSANLELTWAQTSVPVRITTDIDEAIMKNIETALSPDDRRPYFQAASYYYENNKDLTKALEWVNKAVEQNPKAFWVSHLKAKIQLKQNDKKGAIATAEQSMALAREAKNDDYVRLNEKLIADARKK